MTTRTMEENNTGKWIGDLGGVNKSSRQNRPYRGALDPKFKRSGEQAM